MSMIVEQEPEDEPSPTDWELYATKVQTRKRQRCESKEEERTNQAKRIRIEISPTMDIIRDPTVADLETITSTTDSKATTEATTSDLNLEATTDLNLEATTDFEATSSATTVAGLSTSDSAVPFDSLTLSSAFSSSIASSDSQTMGFAGRGV
jgi:hypothetical protein